MPTTYLLAGLMVAGWAGPLGTLAFDTQVPVEVELSASVLIYALFLCIFVGLGAGLIPGFQASRPDLISTLRDANGQGPRRRRLLAIFVTVQIAVTFVLLHATGLLTRSLVNITESPNAEPASIATLRLHPRLVSCPPDRAEAIRREVLSEIEALPEVRSVGFAKRRPLWSGLPTTVALPGESSESGAPARTTGLQPVSPRTFESLGLSILRGRDFDPHDTPDSPPVLVVNSTLAESLWPDREVVGQQVILQNKTHEVIGVVQDCPYRTLIWGRSPQAFSAFSQDLAHPDARFVIRFAGNASAHLPVLRDIVHRIDPAIPVTEIGTLSQQLRRDLSSVFVAGQLTGFVAVLAALLSAAGLSGVLALAVAQQVREIGIRKALGANRQQVIALVIRQSMGLVGIALGCGLLASAALSSAIEHFLYGVDPHDPWVLAGTLLILPGIATLASWWPAHKAAGVDPVVSLRG